MINSMILIEAFLITLLICTCIYVTITDVKKGLIQNKIILVSGIIGIIANIFYYTLFARAFFFAFILNLTVMSIISILFYVLHIWAAGDSKLLILTILLIPARIYFQGNNVAATASIMIIIFSIAYIYIIGESIYLGIKEKNLFKINQFDVSITQTVQQYIKCICLVLLFGIFMRYLAPEFYKNNTELVMILNMLIVLCSYNIKIFDKLVSFCLLCITTVICCILTYTGEFNIDLKICLFVLAVFILRLFMTKYNYQTIPTQNVEKGMVISYLTIVNFIPSKIKGLPLEKATEDIRSRISEEEAASIRRWEMSKYGKPEIVIVRKMPFAIFISIGTLVFVFVRLVIK